MKSLIFKQLMLDQVIMKSTKCDGLKLTNLLTALGESINFKTNTYN